ncbi:MAG: undecaprenyl/decaprenyl-phosphate alpha-N-acetylglucosaminyl 1-phosphate transferase [Candidatus Eremiobacteraeota bacterium]|nr:undecaprenyl/decaprenyl-phosphate alpha-N-acetylglucosaminyl 1-phosphate transferase [Candidatus Eremiobacteraeota bacterium]
MLPLAAQRPFNIDIEWLCGITFVLAALTCAVVTPLVRRMAFAVGVFDQPDGERRIHSQPTPRLGGIAIFIGFMLALFAILNLALGNNFVIHHFLGTADLAHIIGLLFGGTLMLGVGLWDDIMGMKPRRKLAAQFGVAVIAIVLYKFTIYGFTLPHFGYVSLGWAAIPFTLFWYLGMVNAINFMDGLDGLVTGVTLIAALTMIVVSLWHHEYLVAITMCALGGAAAGFLPFNYNPARIFMGDGGSLFIGFVLASASVMGTEKVSVAISLAVPLLVLALPIFDTASVIVRRLRKRSPIFLADRSHMHYQLLEFGLSQRQVVIVLYFVCGILGAIALVLSRPGGPHIF